jgi:hypothetical protein
MSGKIRYKQGDCFNYWTLIKYVKEERKWEAECICGKVKLVWINHLVTGKSISCSCMTKHTHSMTNTPVYRSWASAKSRCITPTNDRYSSYGGRGITMCDRWLNSFENFLEDMGERPESMSLDRIDVDGNYETSNCRWATAKEQSNNTRSQKERGGSLQELADKSSLSVSTIQTRLSRGWSLEKTLETPMCQGKKGQTYGQITTLSMRNSSGVRGVHQKKRDGRWCVQLKVAGKIRHYGTFTTLEEAEVVVTKAREDIKKEFNL